MSKFKSYAEQGSFGGNYIKLPDQTSKIKEATARRLSKMDRAQSFLQKNREEYLQAQKSAQNIEADQREQNEQARRKAQQDYIDALKRDADIEAKNTQAQIDKQEQLFRDLSQFSATALKTVFDLGDARQKRKIEQANAIVRQTGLNYKDAVSFTNIDKTFTEQEAFASDEGQRILNTYGDTPEIRSFLSNARKGRASHIYLQNKQLVLNSVNNELPGYLDQKIQSLDPSMDGPQKLAQIDLAVGEFVKQFGMDPRILEGIAGDRIRAITNSYKETQIQINTANERVAFTQQRMRVMDSLLGPNNDNIQALVKFITTNPSVQKNQELADWAINKLRSGSMSLETYYDLFFKKQYKRDGKDTSFFDQFQSTKWFVEIDAALKEARRVASSTYQQGRIDTINQINAEMARVVDQEFLEDRFISRDEEKKLENMLPPGFRLEDIPIYNDRIQYLTNDYRAGVEFERRLEERVRNKTLTRDFIDNQQLPPEVRDKALAALKRQEESMQDENYKFNLGTVEDMVFNEGPMAGTIATSYKGNFNKGNIESYQAVLVNKFHEALIRTNGDSTLAAQLVRDFHMKTGGSETGFDPLKGFVYINERRTLGSTKAQQLNTEYITLKNSAAEFYSTGNAEIIQQSLKGTAMFTDLQSHFNNPAKGIPRYITRIAELNGKMPIEVMYDLSKAAGLGEYEPGQDNYTNIVKNLSPLPVDFKLNNTYRYAQERNLRAFNVPSSGRGKFAGQSFGKQLTQLDIARYAVKAGFTPTQARVMSAIGIAESNGLVGTDTVQSGLDPDKKNEYSIGIFQINVLVHKDKLDRRGFTVEDMRNPEKNAIIAKDVYDERVATGRDGYEPWSVYTNGKYKKHLETFTFD